MIWFAVIAFGKTILAVLAKLPWWVWVVVGLVILGFVVYHKGETDGAARIQARWDQAVTDQISVGNRAHEQAEASVPPAPAVAPVKPCVVRDRFDRDCK